MPNNKAIRQLIKDAKQWSGWRVEETKSGWMLYPPDSSKPPIAIHKTPSDHRAWKNMISRLRKAGAPF